MSGVNDPVYGGDVPVAEAWRILSEDPKAILIDVRTEAEWAFVGVPELGTIGKSALLVAWNVFPPGPPLTDFVERLEEELSPLGADADTPLYFICRSGARSRNAAIAATAAGFARCFNVVEGFEGALGPDGHRATKGSWKAEGLPWTQS